MSHKVQDGLYDAGFAGVLSMYVTAGGVSYSYVTGSRNTGSQYFLSELFIDTVVIPSYTQIWEEIVELLSKEVTFVFPPIVKKLFEVT